MPVYNAENYVNKGIMSIVNQTYNNWELIIIDDGSNDNTYNVCKKMIFDPIFNINDSSNLSIYFLYFFQSFSYPNHK